MLAETLLSARSYSDAGYAVFKVSGKVPAVKEWQKTEYVLSGALPEILGDWHGNIGVVLSENDLVIDVDPRNFKNDDKPHKRLFESLGIDIKNIGAIARTGGGGAHIYLRIPDGTRVKKNLDAYPGLDFLSKGCYVVGVSSIHPDTKKSYEWHGGKKLSEIGEAPPGLIDLIRKTETAVAISGVPNITDDSPEAIARFQSYLKNAPVSIQGDHGDQTAFKVAAVGRDLGLTGIKTADLMLAYWNHNCIPEWTPRELRYKVHNAYSYASNPPGAATPAADFVEVVDVPVKHSLFRGWDRYENGKLQKTLNNVFNHFLTSDSPLRDAVAYDQFHGQVRIQKRLPWHDKPLKLGGAEWSDDDSVQLRLWLSREKQFDVQINVVDQAVLAAAQLSLLHPVRDYLRALRWDGVPRLETWLTEYAGAADNRFVREASKKFLLQAVSRIYHPGCKADHIVVLEGDQGVGKSSLVEILGGIWYGDIIIDPHSRDTVDAMRGKWFLEFSEMEVVKRSDAQAMKAFITRKVDRVRLAYGRRSIDLPRQCVFMGTINPDATGEWMSDTTGNRRFWPVHIEQVKFQELAEARDQLFAEAADAVLKGQAAYIVDREIVDMAVAEQSARQHSDPWIHSIANWIDGGVHEFVTTKDVWVFALKGNEANFSGIHQRRIAGVLKELGYVRDIRRYKGTVMRGFCLAGAAEGLEELI